MLAWIVGALRGHGLSHRYIFVLFALSLWSLIINRTTMSQGNNNVKLIVMGQGGVGKSCLTQQFCLNRFVGDSVSTPRIDRSPAPS